MAYDILTKNTLRRVDKRYLKTCRKEFETSYDVLARNTLKRVGKNHLKRVGKKHL